MIVPLAKAPRIPRLRDGDRLTRAEFDRRYEAEPNLKKAELINGVVHMPSPVRLIQHGQPHLDLGFCLGLYQKRTPGVRGGLDASLRLDDANELQPDGLLYILPDYGGRMRIDRQGYITTGPDLVAEVAAATVKKDMGEKLEVYRRHRIKEYIVWRVEDKAFSHFVLGKRKYDDIPLKRGILRSVVFPGLWLAAAALVAGDDRKVYRTLQRGIRGAEHQAFVEELAARKKV